MFFPDGPVQELPALPERSLHGLLPELVAVRVDHDGADRQLVHRALALLELGGADSGQLLWVVLADLLDRLALGSRWVALLVPAGHAGLDAVALPELFHAGGRHLIAEELLHPLGHLLRAHAPGVVPDIFIHALGVLGLVLPVLCAGPLLHAVPVAVIASEGLHALVGEAGAALVIHQGGQLAVS